MNLIKLVEQEQLKKEPYRSLAPGDTVRVHLKVVEGERKRIQVFEGVVIARANGGLRETFTVRKISGGIGVERGLSLAFPMIAKIEVVRRGRVGRAKLYYLRKRSGKSRSDS